MKLKPLFLASAVALMLAAGLAHAEGDTERQQKILETRMRMATAKFLVRNGKKEEAAAMMRALFPNGPPGGETALEYYHIISSTPKGWDEAKVGLEKLVKAEPYVMLYRRELAKHLITREATRRAGIRILAAMARQPDADKPLTMEAWQGALSMLGSGPGDAQMYREYLAVDPANEEIRERFAKAQQGSSKPKPAASKPAAPVQHRGLVLLEEGNLEEAERVLAEAREKSPDDPEITGGLGLIRLRQGRHAEAKELFERALGLDADNRSKWENLAATATFWKLMGESAAARGAKNPDIAEEKVRAALRLEPDNAEGIALLGGILSDRGNLAEAEKHYRESLRLDPANGSAIRGLSGLLSGQGRRAEVIALLDNLGGEQAAAKYAYIRAGVLRDEADILSAAGRTAGAEALLKKALQMAPEMPWVRFDLARFYQKQGLSAQGRALMKEGLEAMPDDPQMLYANALFLVGLGEADDALLLLDRISHAERTPSMSNLMQKAKVQSLIRKAGTLGKDSPELRAELDAIAAIPSLSPEAAQELYAFRESLAVRKANAQLESGAPGLAHQTLEPLLESSPDSASLLHLKARAYQAEKQWASAQSIYAHILRLDTGDNNAMRGQIETLLASGDRFAALAQLDKWAAGGTPDNPYNGLKIVELYLALGEPVRARQQLDTLLEKYPNQPNALYEAAQMAHRDGRLDDEITYLKRSIAEECAERASISVQRLPQAPDKPAPYQQIGFDELDSPKKIQRDWKEKKLAALIDRRSDWVFSAVDIRSRNGTAGLSKFNSVEIPLEYKTTWRMDDEVFFRTDLVRLNAGTVASANSDFGSMLLCQPICTSARLQQTAQGVSFMAGYQRTNLSIDIGSTPRNFPVANVVGGIKQKGDLGEFGYSLEASRRPITASLLSFAGTKDPNTGKVWGGVVATGGRLGLSFDKGGAFGFWSSAGLHNLTGSNVQSSRRIQVMAGEQWRAINDENRKLIFGLTGMYMNFTENAGEYSFGHGGYYSPQNYRSLSFPVTYTRRTPRFSYMLRAAVSTSYSQSKFAQRYPTDSVLQAQAEALRASAPPNYAGGWSYSNGYSLRAAWEYQATPRIFLGGLLAIDKSESYSPNQALFYLRYSLDRPGSQPVFLPPEPIEPSSQFY